jgi:hypothetical protein
VSSNPEAWEHVAQFYRNDPIVLARRSALRFVSHLLDEALLQTADHSRRRGELRATLVAARVKPYESPDVWRSPRVRVDPKADLCIGITRCLSERHFVEVYATVHVHEATGVKVRWGARTEHGETEKPKRTPDKRDARYPQWSEEVPRPPHARDAARDLVGRILGILDRHDPAGVYYSTSVLHDAVNSAMKLGLKRRESRKAAMGGVE